MKFINPKAFIISLTIGIFLVYAFNPRPDIIYVYPTPDNIDTIQYKDKSGSCVGFDMKEITCPNNKNIIREYPIQEGREKKNM
jgi:hypothetical protein